MSPLFPMAFLTPSASLTASLSSPLPANSVIPSPSSGCCFIRRFSSSSSLSTAQLLEDPFHSFGQLVSLQVLSTCSSGTARKACPKLAASTFYLGRFSGEEALHNFANIPALRRRRKAGMPASSNTAPVDLETPLYDNVAHVPRRIAIFVEPSPFTYVSGYKNRFQNFIKYLKELGDEVIVVTTHEGAPDHFYGAKIIPSWSFPCPWYTVLPLSLALSPRILMEIAKFKPDIIHASSPGVMVIGAIIIAKLLRVPLVLSYHTHIPLYIPKYTYSWLVKPMWLIIKFLHRAADLTLVTSNVVGRELQAAGAAAAYKIRLWQKGVDSESFHPRFKSSEMRVQLTNGDVDKPLIVNVGRLGAEKNLDFLKKVMEKIPEARFAFVGDGPQRQELERLFKGMPVVFTGMLHGEQLSQAYASGDVFMTPSESETLGFVVLEAMASGVPIVAARAGGIPDIIPLSQEGGTGFLYKAGDIDDCISKLKILLESKEFRQKMGAAGRTEVEKHNWRAATRHVRNVEYNAAIWFWKKRRNQLCRCLMWCVRRNFMPGG